MAPTRRIRELAGSGAASTVVPHWDPEVSEGDCVEPLVDSEVPGWWQRLGLPGVVDIHTHFLPERMLRRVWGHFDEVGPLIGRPWPIEYRDRGLSRCWQRTAAWSPSRSRRPRDGATASVAS